MLARLAPVLVARRRLVLVLAVLFLALAGGLGAGVATELSAGGFADPKQQSEVAASALERDFGTGPSNFLLLVTVPGGVDTADASGTALTRRLAGEPGVADVASYWTAGKPATLKSRDGTQALVLARLTGSQDDAVTTAKALATTYDGSYRGLQVVTGGEFAVYAQVGDTIEKDIIRAESIAIPVTAVLLVLVFGSAVAASLPLLVGVLSILGTFLVLHLLHQVTDVSVYSVNLATSMGLGLGIDYSLFLVTRFREELRAGREVGDAVRETLRTAGRTVLFSALTVMLSLSALLVFPLYFLKSFAYAGIGAVLFAVLGALLVLPAALAALGHRIDALDLRRPLRRLLRLPAPRVKELDEGFWHRVAVTVMRRPVGVGTAVVLLLVLLGLPFRNVVFSLPDDRVLPRSASAHQVAQVLRENFPGREAFALPVLVSDPRSPAAYAIALSKVPGVERVDASTGRYVEGARVAAGVPAYTNATASRLEVVPAVEPYGPQGETLVRALRAVPAPAPVLIGGSAAQLTDTKAALGHRLPLALAMVLLATFLLLFLFTGSFVIPIKALVLNVLSLSATFGMMVWVFQEGHLTGLLGDPLVTGTLDTTMPILMFCVLFGLSMDYEVFLLSRIKEEYDATGDNARAVAVGLERTGALVTAAAALLALVFLSFVTSGISFIKLLGLGTALAVLVDATLVRGALVPAFMQLMGERNWWAPAWAKRLHARFGLAEAHSLNLVPSLRRKPLPSSPAAQPRRRAPRGQGAALRGEVLGAAMELLRETGAEQAVSLRAVAQRVGVSVPSIYLHFADKQALLDAVCEEVFEQLFLALKEASADAADPFDALRRQGAAYVQFAVANPEHYRIVMMGGAIGARPGRRDRLGGVRLRHRHGDGLRRPRGPRGRPGRPVPAAVGRGARAVRTDDRQAAVPVATGRGARRRSRVQPRLGARRGIAAADRSECRGVPRAVGPPAGLTPTGGRRPWLRPRSWWPSSGPSCWPCR